MITSLASSLWSSVELSVRRSLGDRFQRSCGGLLKNGALLLTAQSYSFVECKSTYLSRLRLRTVLTIWFPMNGDSLGEGSSLSSFVLL